MSGLAAVAAIGETVGQGDRPLCVMFGRHKDDMKKAEAVLAWAVDKMEERYEWLHRARVRNIASYNELPFEEIARRVESELQYPGQIKVVAIRTAIEKAMPAGATASPRICENASSPAPTWGSNWKSTRPWSRPADHLDGGAWLQVTRCFRGFRLKSKA